VIGHCVRPGTAPAHHPGQRLAGVVTVGQQGVMATVAPDDPCWRVCTLGASCEDASVPGSDSGRVERSSAGVGPIRGEIRST
jgi:hypothetical protein